MPSHSSSARDRHARRVRVSLVKIGRALLQLLQLVSLESWSTTQMYCLLDGVNLLYSCMQGDVSFDNIGRALLQVLQVVSLESWSTTQMYYLLDGIGDVVVIYYLCLIVIGTYFALNLLVAVISAKFAQLHVSPSPYAFSWNICV